MKPSSDLLNRILASRQFITADLYMLNLATGAGTPLLYNSLGETDLVVDLPLRSANLLNTELWLAVNATITAVSGGGFQILSSAGSHAVAAAQQGGTNSTIVPDQSGIAYPLITSGTISVVAKAGTVPYLWLNFAGNSFNGNYATAVFNLTTNVLTETSIGGNGGQITATSIKSIGNGLSLVSMSYSLAFDAMGNGGAVGVTPLGTGNTYQTSGFGTVLTTQAGTETIVVYEATMPTRLKFLATGQTGPYFDRKDNKAKVTWKLGTGNDQLVIDVIPGSATIGNLSFLDAVRCGVFDAADFQLFRAFMQPYPDPQTTLLVHFDGVSGSKVITDSSIYGNVLTANNNAALDSADLKFGTASLKLGAGDYVGTPSSHLFDMNGDFTVEFWFDFSNMDPSDNGGQYLFISGPIFFRRWITSEHSGVPGGIEFGLIANGTEVGRVVSVSTFYRSMRPGWHHVAAVRSSGTAMLFIDGVLEGSRFLSQPGDPSTRTGTQIGPGSSFFDEGLLESMHIDEFRFTQGLARYTANFTPPMGPFDSTYFYPVVQAGCAVLLFQGRVAEVDADRSLATFTINDYRELLSQQLPRNLFAASCQNSFGDASCTVVLANFSENGVVLTGTTQSVINATLIRASDYYDMGKITFTSGQLKGLSFGVSTWTQGTPGTIALFNALPHMPASGDTFTIAPGCDKTFAGGCTKYSNTPNFRGFPYTPAPETAL